MKLLLFDIDGTLVLTGGAGLRAMTRALEAVCGVPDGMTRVAVGGRTDRIILRDLLAPPGAEVLDEDLLTRIRQAYCPLLREELRANNGGPGVLPGVRALLDTLQGREDVAMALLTGNFPETAEIKLGFYDLWQYFTWGAFGDEAYDRNDLLPIALDRHRLRGQSTIDPADVVIIGDTPHDVACAHAGGARAIAVATGTHSAEDLRACGAHAVLDDLSDTRRILELVSA